MASLPAAAVAVAAVTSPINVVCNNDNTIDVTIDYNKPATVLEFKYGTCTKDTVRANLTQNASFGWQFQLDVTACGMDNKLRTLEYNQTALMRVGRVSGNTELTMANFDIDSYCTYTSTYIVKYDYGLLSTESHEFESDAGLIDLTFSLKSYDDDYSAEATHSKQAGEKINLGLSILNANFNHADDIATSSSGKVFAPKSCEVKDSDDQSYTLFDHAANSCKNADVDFKISFSQDDNMWRFSHMLFLIGNTRKSTLSLECIVIVCDKSRSEDCDAVVKACLAPVNATYIWRAWDACTVTCGGGKQSRKPSCIPAKFFGQACPAPETRDCETQFCPDPRCMHGDWFGPTNVECTKYQKCVNTEYITGDCPPNTYAGFVKCGPTKPDFCD